MQHNNQNIISQVKQVLQEANITVTSEFDELFDSVSNAEPFAGLDTEYLQTKYYKENFRLLVRTFNVLHMLVEYT